MITKLIIISKRLPLKTNNLKRKPHFYLSDQNGDLVGHNICPFKKEKLFPALHVQLFITETGLLVVSHPC